MIKFFLWHCPNHRANYAELFAKPGTRPQCRYLLLRPDKRSADGPHPETSAASTMAAPRSSSTGPARTLPQFWNTNIPNYLMDKTFHVLPTTNNPSGSYNITLFYTQAEVNGWQTFTGQNISSIQLVKVPAQISNVNGSQPDRWRRRHNGHPPSISTIGTNTGLTYNFTNGFLRFRGGSARPFYPAHRLIEF